MKPETSVENIDETTKPSADRRVVRYWLALLLIVLPLMGSWAGYNYALSVVNNNIAVDTVEVSAGSFNSEPAEEVKTDDSAAEVEEDAQSDFAYVGQKIGGMRVKEISAFNEEYSEMSPENVKIKLEGPIKVTGTFELFKSEIGFSDYCMSEFTPESTYLLPYVPAFLPLASEYGKPTELLCFRNDEVVQSKLGSSTQRVTVIIDNYELQSYPSEVVDRADLIDVVSDFPPGLDFYGCVAGESLEGAGGFHSSLSLYILGDSRYDDYCHVISIEQTSMGAGAYWLNECWVPKSLGYMSGQETEAYINGYTMPNIREYCTQINFWEGDATEL